VKWDWSAQRITYSLSHDERVGETARWYTLPKQKNSVLLDGPLERHSRNSFRQLGREWMLVTVT
jgi:hypothetical protein